MKALVEQILVNKSDEQPSIETAQRKERTVSLSKSFQRYTRHLGDRVPTSEERDDLLMVKNQIEQILSRKEDK